MPCACTTVRLNEPTLSALRTRYDGCLCVPCLHQLALAEQSAPKPASPGGDGPIERGLDAFTAWLMPLAIAITLLLFAQWPLRDAIGAGSTQANDLAQWLFACYVAVSLRHATRQRAHLTARSDLAAACDPASPQRSRWRSIGAALCLLPWAMYMLYADAPVAWQSLQLAERFPETNNPGYFMTHVALLLLALLAMWQGGRDLWRALRPLPG